MGAFFSDDAVVQDEDHIGILDGRETVSDDEGGTAHHEFIESILHDLFTFGIERRGGFVED